MPLRVGISQFAPTLGDLDRNLALIEARIERGREENVDLLVFPELALTGYTLKDMAPTVAQRRDSVIIRKLAAASDEMSVVVGFVEESDDYRLYNAAGYFENGKLRHVHRKVYLPTYGMFEETRYLASGDRIRAFDTKHGRMAMLICEDMWHPSAPYITSQDGCEVLIGVASSPARGVQEDDDIYSAKAWRALNRVYAHFFGQYVVFANRVGFEDGVAYWGGSEIVGPGGEVVARAAQLEEEFLVGSISSQRVRRARIVSPLLRDERLDLTMRELERIQGERMR
ncbi:carbon-nitrogen hydrolase [Candidatus Poribacteria bacterium]|jgi:predicted amidohydrolase|nr:carbon-nitrogen hydrolase [Candidatus Poribacteria bacterium]MBT5532080.1 carbon-nitrogen hydrolase [Candidatus Poribacteria bacterium]MBT7099049.1 carbon-nitrogen hydrolase [Candidatus Poribacteria bacterium]MBT7806030.1 carbon-nitrogen hydrolase [Candidatus Poribacteria bacterium]